MTNPANMKLAANENSFSFAFADAASNLSTLTLLRRAP
jgi:hypothetical protein